MQLGREITQYILGLTARPAPQQGTHLKQLANIMLDKERMNHMSGLAFSKVQEVFPVARSDRRLNKDIFTSFVAEEQLRNDEAFYPALTAVIANGDVSQIIEYDNRMASRGHEYKTFGVRAIKFLQASKSGDLGLDEIPTLPDDYFLPGSPEAVVFGFLRRLVSSHATRSEFDEPVDLSHGGANQDWQAVAAQVARLAGELAEPDAILAQKILDLATTLVLACETAEADAALRADCDALQDKIRGRLQVVLPDVSEIWPDLVTPDFLKSLEVALDELGGLEVNHLAADEALSNIEVAVSNAKDDDDALMDLLPRRKLAKSAVQSCSKQIDDLREEITSLLTIATGELGANRQAIAMADAPVPSAYVASDPDGALEVTVISDPGVEADEAVLDADLTDGAASLHVDYSAAVSPAEHRASFGSAPALDDDSPSDMVISGTLGSASESALGSDASMDVSDDTRAIGVSIVQIGGAVDEVLDSRLLEYLDEGEPMLAFRLAELSEKRGLRPIVPSDILKAFVIGQGVRRSEDMADQRRSEALARMMGAVSEKSDMASGDLTTLVAFAALLRPALFDPDSGARVHMRKLPREGMLQHFSNLIEMIGALGHDIRLSVEDFAELSGAQRRPQVPEAEEALRLWLGQAINRKTGHQPTYSLLHKELETNGEIGRVIKAVLDHEVGASAGARSFNDRYKDDRSEQEKFVREAEKRSGRPRRDKIEGMALEWFCQRIGEACLHLDAWLSAQASDAAVVHGGSGDRLRPVVGAIGKELADIQSAFDLESVIDARLARALRRALDDFSSVIAGTAEQGPAPKFGDLFKVPMLRLPGDCQDWSTSEEDFSEERALADDRCLAALMQPNAVVKDLSIAYERRLAERAFLCARALWNLLRGSDATDAGKALPSTFDQSLMAARLDGMKQVQLLRQALTTVSYLENENATQLKWRLAQLSFILEALRSDPGGPDVSLPALNGIRKPDVPPDFPELAYLLAMIGAELDELQTSVRDRQRRALVELERGVVAASARALIERLESLDPVTVDDAIAELTAGRPVPLPEIENADPFEIFFPFVIEALDQTASEQLATGRIIEAMRSRESIGPLDFSQLNERDANRSHILLEKWRTAENATRSGSNQDRLRLIVTDILSHLGFTGVETMNSAPARANNFVAKFDVPTDTDWFLPPVFGSESQGRYRIFAATKTAPIEQIEREIGSSDPDAPWLVLYFGRMPVVERRRLGEYFRPRKRKILVLDDNLLLHLLAQQGDLLPIFYACSLPFSWVQPYTTRPRQIPPEIFFGRREEISRITARESGGCLIYGGRQLGKSALLNHIQRQRNRPAAGELAIYLDIKPIGGPGSRLEQIWDEFSHELRRTAPFANLSNDPQKIVSSIEHWLSAEPGRRLLTMFDEADNFLAREHATGYLNLQRFKSLMEGSAWRFKAVFAGLHNVRRMSQAPNSPFPHLGHAICIGPMNLTEENRRELRNLAVEPLKSAGLKYASPSLASDMLARMNYYPSLVQVFGQQIVESVGRKPPNAAAGPRWSLSRENLFEGEAAERISEQIRERFQWTLNLDLRYELIAKSIALHRLDSLGGEMAVLARGLSAAEIDNVVLWPERLARPGRADLEELLQEMEELGVLGKFPNTRFGLRNAQVAQMLGGRERLNADLTALLERDDDPAYDAALFYSLLRPNMPDVRSPLSDRQLQRVFDRQGVSLKVIVGQDVVVGPNLGLRMQAAAHILGGSDYVQLVSQPSEANLRRVLEQAGGRRGIVIIDGPWSEKTAEALLQQDKLAAGQILIIWCVAGQPLPLPPGVDVTWAGAWTEPMLRHWLRDEGLSPALDDRASRDAIMQASGGAPARLSAMRQRLAELSAYPVDERVNQLVDWTREHPFGHDHADLSEADHEVLQALKQYGDLVTCIGDLQEVSPNCEHADLSSLQDFGLISLPVAENGTPILTALGRLLTR